MSDDDTALLAWADAGALRYAQRPLGGGFTAGTVPGSIAYPSARPQARYGADGAARLLWTAARPAVSVQTARIAPDGASSPAAGRLATVRGAGRAERRHQRGDRPGRGRAGRRRRVVAAQLRRCAGPGVRHAHPRAHRGARRHAADDHRPPRGRERERRQRGGDVGVRHRRAVGQTTTWDFGDGGSAQGKTVNKAFLVPGAFTVRVTVTDDAGNTTTAQRHVRVSGRAGPVG